MVQPMTQHTDLCYFNMFALPSCAVAGRQLSSGLYLELITPAPSRPIWTLAVWDKDPNKVYEPMEAPVLLVQTAWKSLDIIVELFFAPE